MPQCPVMLGLHRATAALFLGCAAEETSAPATASAGKSPMHMASLVAQSKRSLVYVSVSQCNHRVPGGEAHPDVVQGTATCPHQSADALLPHADPVCDETTALVVYLYHAGNAVACKTGIRPPFHHHGRGQRDGITILFLPVGAVGAALAVLHVACCRAQPSCRRRPEATRAHATIPQAPSGPGALSWPHPHAPLRGLCAGSCAAPTGALRPPTPPRLHAWPPAPGGHVVALLPAAPLCLSGLGGAGQSPCQWASQRWTVAPAVLHRLRWLFPRDPWHAVAWEV